MSDDRAYIPNNMVRAWHDGLVVRVEVYSLDHNAWCEVAVVAPREMRPPLKPHEVPLPKPRSKRVVTRECGAISSQLCLAFVLLFAAASPASAQDDAPRDVPPEVLADLQTARAGIGAAQDDLAEMAALGAESRDTIEVSERDVRAARDEIGEAREITATVRQRQQTWTDLLGALTSWIPGGDLMLGALLAALGVGAIPQTRRVAVQGVRAVRAGLDIQPDRRRPPHIVAHNGNVQTHATPPKYASKQETA